MNFKRKKRFPYLDLTFFSIFATLLKQEGFVAQLDRASHYG
jgi:hypothetical protein